MSIHLVGSDDVPPDSKIATTIALNEALTAGSQGPRIAERFTLEQIALARQCMKCGMAQGRVVLTM